ncbi:MAG TPA: hypothetical protein VFJ53_05020, partial [Solirubrobacterales bacterium]|nr:hypothetical protein [Solirubrobacterales bacterium]
ATEAIFGGIYSLAYRQLREIGAGGLPALAPLCTYLALAPFVGAQQAADAANGDGRSRVTPDLLDDSTRERAKILIETAEWEAIPVPEREKISAYIASVVLDEVTRSMRAGLFDRRPERFLTHVPARVDEEGWLELSRIHEEALKASLQAIERAKERLERSGEEGLDVRSVQTLFEVPKRPD